MQDLQECSVRTDFKRSRIIRCCILIATSMTEREDNERQRNCVSTPKHTHRLMRTS
jgi:hypothetical protein